MHRILFVCHGNICRSPMAECLLKDMVRNRSGDFLISSAATSTEEIGNPIHPGTRRKLKEMGVPLCGHRAVQLTPRDYGLYDWILGMDSANIRNILRITGGDPKEKVRRLLDFSKRPRDIADPWYTGDFDVTYEDIREGCIALLQALK
ncbi:low molecular weight phosphotyrosine protein phosphatase [Oscillibacter sp. MSJ-2]|uniref:protein-tyrosine-phosphatase n=1 Tax=Dysosmobacter acutus TaxID=2841504 RepID=A0ABS6FAH9_9FIRM|nr:low molecular weight protein-tyrosine-phosphatase [Dysosmobacter acutus]MBU5626651.1 low molecular weight phosphotyrosine protein phosphatase [Dysosmobacter acutus]